MPQLLGRAAMGVDYLFRRRGPLTMSPSQLGVFTRSDSTQDRANIQYHVQPLSLDKFGEPLHPFPAFTASVANLRPTSRGAVKLRSADPAPPRRSGRIISRRRRTAASPPIPSASRAESSRSRRSPEYTPEEYLPGAHVPDDDEAALEQAAGDIGTTIFHPVGTARMGRDDDLRAVVDARLRVIGLQGLARDRRVGDAVDHVGQHQLADDDDRGEGRGDGVGG